jgi:hypothetical protein
MKKTILISLIAFMTFGFGIQLIAQPFQSADKFQVIVEVVSGTHGDFVHCDFDIFNADGTLYDQVRVTEPSSTYMNFKTNISYNPGMYFRYQIKGIESSPDIFHWYIYYNQSDPIYTYTHTKTLAWFYGIPPFYIE